MGRIVILALLLGVLTTVFLYPIECRGDDDGPGVAVCETVIGYERTQKGEEAQDELSGQMALIALGAGFAVTLVTGVLGALALSVWRRRQEAQP